MTRGLIKLETPKVTKVTSYDTHGGGPSCSVSRSERKKQDARHTYVLREIKHFEGVNLSDHGLEMASP